MLSMLVPCYFENYSKRFHTVFFRGGSSGQHKQFGSLCSGESVSSSRHQWGTGLRCPAACTGSWPTRQEGLKHHQQTGPGCCQGNCRPLWCESVCNIKVHLEPLDSAFAISVIFPISFFYWTGQCFQCQLFWLWTIWNLHHFPGCSCYWCECPLVVTGTCSPASEQCGCDLCPLCPGD